MFQAAAMRRLDQESLTDMALAALEEVAARCYFAPVAKNRALALVLAYLASRTPRPAPQPHVQASSFKHFWNSIEMARPNDRWANVHASLNGIYLTIGRKRNWHTLGGFEREAREAALKEETNALPN